MTTVRKLTPEEIGNILQKGDFAELVATVEYESLECKNALYDLKLPVAKIELAKDVSALANAKGGHLLLRVSTKKNATHKGDEKSATQGRRCGQVHRLGIFRSE